MERIRKIISVYKGIPIQAKASMWFVMSTVILKGISFITVPIFTRIMNTDQYGIYSVYLTWFEMLTVIGTFSLESCSYMSVLTRFEDRDKEEAQFSLLELSFLLTSILLIIVLIFSDSIVKFMGLSKSIIYLMLIQIYFIPTVNFWSVRSRFRYRYKSLVFVSLSMAVFNAVLGILFVTNSVPEQQAYSRIVSVVCVQVIYGIVLFRILNKGYKFSISTKYWNWAIRLHVPLLPHMLSLKILGSADRIMINSMIGATDAALYSAVFSISVVVNLIKTSIVDAIRPWIYQKLEDNQGSELKKNLKGILLFVAVLTLICIAFGPEILFIATPDKYHSAVYCMPPIMISSFFTFMYSVFSIVEMYYEETKKIMLASICAAIFNVVLNYIFIPKYGYIAAAYTTLICYIFLAVFHALMVKKISGKHCVEIELFDKKWITGVSGILLVIMLLFELLYKKMIYRYAFMSVILVITYIKRKDFISAIKSIRQKE